MEKTIKTKLAIGAFAAALGLLSILPSSGYAMKSDVLDRTWGKPAKVEKTEKGGEIRYYKLEKIPNGYRIFEIRKDGEVIDRGYSVHPEVLQRYFTNGG